MKKEDVCTWEELLKPVLTFMLIWLIGMEILIILAYFLTGSMPKLIM